ncbi:hypothetical protein P22_0790 [Propionispora sp. 2/2-37]|uniref:DUF523 domain-containing protein n=1 Tax=Propionispora sp. 2/2-37 TaxID=1677858 RepID=UPI0006BF67DE|nr:DUF523 domain-containing protein [Propionispora sp. 2/2-37]CUH94724.1 hypothetical protein P22_0790 [Propionispora sp. 2/2-37]
MIIASACLAGVECRYNGQAFPVPQIIECAAGESPSTLPGNIGKSAYSPSECRAV